MAKERGTDVFKNIIPYFMELAIEQTAKEQIRILKVAKCSKHYKEYFPLIEDISKFSMELISWQRGKVLPKDPINSFRKKALRIEKKADKLAERLWKSNQLNIVCIFNYALQEQARSKNNFEMMLRTHYDVQRGRLLEQVRGARLLQQNSDLGDDVEKIFLEYLRLNLDSDCMVVRGGHIFDRFGKRSAQMDIIVIQAKTLSICPATTENGKYNVFVDQVIAAISVKSTLTEMEFEEAWNGLQSIPVYKDKANDFPRFVQGSEQAWPLCFIISANSSDLRKLNSKWDTLIAKGQTHQLQLFMSLQRGYSIAGNSSWPLINYKDDYKGSWNHAGELQAGLGLGLILNSILARSALVSNRPLKIYEKQRGLLDMAGALTGCGCPTYNPKYYFMTPKINDIIRWSCCTNIRGYGIGRSLNNNINVRSLHINHIRLVNRNSPLSKKYKKHDGQPYESRWFEILSMREKNNTLHLKEWVKYKNKIGYYSKQVQFNLTTGEEIIDKSTIS